VKIPRRRFLKNAALAGGGALFSGALTSCAFRNPGQTAEDANEFLPAGDDQPRLVELFDDGWRFRLGDAAGAGDQEFDDSEWREIDLPHDWSIELPFDPQLASATAYLPGGVAWYRKQFHLPPSLAGKRVGILFEGVYMNSEVWINGAYLGKRPYGCVSFDYDLTPHLLPAPQTNVLAVRVDHSDYADTRWYSGSGIYRHVWIIATGGIYIPNWGTFVTTPTVGEKFALVGIETRVKNSGAKAAEVALVSSIQDERGREVAKVETLRTIQPGVEFRFQQNTKLPNPRLWSPDDPHLYSVVSRVKAGGAVADEYRTPLGVRTFTFDPDNGFHLNGRKTLFKGVCLHQDAGCFGTAVPARAWEKRLLLLKELGCNAIRTSHNPPSPEFLNLCDRLGFLVMDEAFDEWARPKKIWLRGRNNGRPGYDGYATYFKEWGIADIKAMVERDKNHPSIILWSIGNEIDYPRDPYYDESMRDFSPDKPNATELPGIAANLIQAIKEVDSTRPVTAALANISASNRTGLAGLLDVVGYNYQEADYERDHAQYPGRKLLGSENSHAYVAWQTIEELPYANGQFLWTGADYFGESPGWPVRSFDSGLLDECGFPKPAYYFRQSLWSAKPMVYLAAQAAGGQRSRAANVAAHWTWPVAAGGQVNVLCYTNCDAVELFLNDRSLGEKPISDAQDHVLLWAVAYSPGILKAVGKRDGKALCAFELKTAGEAKAVKLTPDLISLPADGRSLSHIEVTVVDDAGIQFPSADNLIAFEISGPGRLVGVDSGDVRSHELFKTTSRKAYQGRCLAVVQSTGKPGVIKLTATAPGLLPGQISIAAE
jgi:beta-galactosidase